MLENKRPMIGQATSDDNATVTVSACAWPTASYENIEHAEGWKRLANNYGLSLSFADLGEEFEGLPHVHLYVTAATTRQAHIGKGYILAMSDDVVSLRLAMRALAINAAARPLSETPEELAKRLYPLRSSPDGGPLASVESRSMVACVASALATPAAAIVRSIMKTAGIINTPTDASLYCQMST
jgi:hypothetical protein